MRFILVLQWSLTVTQCARCIRQWLCARLHGCTMNMYILYQASRINGRFCEENQWRNDRYETGIRDRIRDAVDFHRNLCIDCNSCLLINCRSRKSRDRSKARTIMHELVQMEDLWSRSIVSWNFLSDLIVKDEIDAGTWIVLQNTVSTASSVVLHFWAVQRRMTRGGFCWSKPLNKACPSWSIVRMGIAKLRHKR